MTPNDRHDFPPDLTAADDVGKLSGAQYVHTLKLAELVMTILGCRQDHPQAAAAALVREPYGKDTLIRVVFLDHKHEPLSAGRVTTTTAVYVAHGLDEDLMAAFGAKNIVILK